MIYIVKRKGHKQEFNERKLYASIYSACLSAHTDQEESDITANLVCREVKKWLEKKEEVTNQELFEMVKDELKHLNQKASFMYSTHRDIS